MVIVYAIVLALLVQDRWSKSCITVLERNEVSVNYDEPIM